MAPALIAMSNVTSDFSCGRILEVTDRSFNPDDGLTIPRRTDAVLSKRLQASRSSDCIDQSPHRHQPGESAGVVAVWADRIGRMAPCSSTFCFIKAVPRRRPQPTRQRCSENCYTDGTEECRFCEAFFKTSCEFPYGVASGL